MKTIHACCSKCWHSSEKPCPDRIACFTEGPLCHESEECKMLIAGRAGRMGTGRTDTRHPVIYIGAGTCGLAAGAERTKNRVAGYLKEKGIEGEIVEVGCIGFCAVEPIVDVQIPGKNRVSFSNVTHDRVDALLDNVLEGTLPEDLFLGQHEQTGLSSWENRPYLWEHPFFAGQKRWVLSNCGIVDPGSIEEYILSGGYRAFENTVKQHTPAEVCAIVSESGLRGRGGGGFPTGKKWELALKEQNEQKYMICNADEGDPGAFMDRAVIEGDPHRLLEGLLIASYAMGASKAYVYIRAEYPLAILRLEQAIKQATALGLLGSNILDSGFSLRVIIKKGAGAFVCGEETALIHSIEGKRGMPRPRPPYPSVQGAFGKPSAINNVETLANIPGILAKGAEWFSSVGTESSKGTKVFALSGKVLRTGLAEVAMGTSVRRIVFDIGGGIPGGRKYKAVQIGGPSGGCIPEQHLDIDVDYESLKTVGAMMGSGGLVVMDDETCMVDVAKYFMDFIQRESCGKCIPCREGTLQMLDILKKLTGSRKTEGDNAALQRFTGILQLEKLANVIRDTSLCGLGQSAPNPVLSTLKWFREEYEEHIFNRSCPAKACEELLTFTIDVDKCTGCTLCSKKCPAAAITGSAKNPHYVVEDKCIGCGTCEEVCRFGAVTVA